VLDKDKDRRFIQAIAGLSGHPLTGLDQSRPTTASPTSATITPADTSPSTGAASGTAGYSTPAGPTIS
jgi:hypothetical protein